MESVDALVTVTEARPPRGLAARFRKDGGRRFTRLFAASFLLGSTLGVTAAAAGDEKVTICHIPPDNPENVQIIDVSPQAAEKHIERHGDLLFSEAGESCDGQDNDCDREVDEDFPDLGSPCSEGIGGCRQTGVLVCSQDGAGTVCSAIAGDPTTEGCADGIDNDCDGATDCGDSDCAFDPAIHDESSEQFACKEPSCGDGFLDVGEDCDDPGNECCAADCTINSGVECDADDNECTMSICSASGVCEPQDTDGDSCTGNGEDACSGPDTCLGGVCKDNGPNAVPEGMAEGNCRDEIDNDCDGFADDDENECRCGPCPQEICEADRKCDNPSLPYQCTSGEDGGGCSSDANFWPARPDCGGCCDFRSCS